MIAKQDHTPMDPASYNLTSMITALLGSLLAALHVMLQLQGMSCASHACAALAHSMLHCAPKLLCLLFSSF